MKNLIILFICFIYFACQIKNESNHKEIPVLLGKSVEFSKIQNDEDGSVNQISRGKLYLQYGDKRWFIAKINQGDSSFSNGILRTDSITDHAIIESDKNKTYKLIEDNLFIKIIVEVRYFDFSNANDEVKVQTKEIFRIKK